MIQYLLQVCSNECGNPDLHDLLLRRWIQEIEPEHVSDPQRLQIQDGISQIHPLNLWNCLIHHIVEALR